MPYNLRKRKIPSPQPVEKKERKRKKDEVVQPVETVQPAKKVKTVEPPASIEPVEAVESVKPVKPVKPVKQVKPAKTVKPVSQAKQEKLEKQEKQEKLEKLEKQEEQEKEEKQEKLAKQEKGEKQEKQAKQEKQLKPDKEEKPVQPVKPIQASNQMVFGSDMGGELGLGKLGFDRKNPIHLPIKEQTKQVACGGMHTVTLTESGKVYSNGCNDDGALGRVTDGEEKLEATPTLVKLDDKVTKITAGDSHCAALTEKMEVYIWGNFRDENGMVGLTPESEGKATFQPTKVKLDKQIKDIASGANHMLLMDVDGVIYSFGVGDHGQLGRLKPEDCAKKITSETYDLFLVPQPVDMKNVDPQRTFVADAIFAGEYTSYATNTDKKKNRTAAWGLNNYHQLGYKGGKDQLDQHYPRRSTFTCSTSMISVSGGQHHTLFLTKSGRVYSAGRNEYGMLGLGKKSLGKGDICPAQEVSGFDSPVKTICTGSRSSFAVTSSGKLYSWGMNGLNLGVEGDDDLTEPTLVEKLADKKVVSVSSGSITSVIVE